MTGMKSMDFDNEKRGLNGGAKSFSRKGTDESKLMLEKMKGTWRPIKPIEGRLLGIPMGIKKEERKNYKRGPKQGRGCLFSTDQQIYPIKLIVEKDSVELKLIQ